MADMTGEADKGALRLDFDRRLLLQFRGSSITSDAGLLAYNHQVKPLLPKRLPTPTPPAGTIGPRSPASRPCRRMRR